MERRTKALNQGIGGYGRNRSTGRRRRAVEIGPRCALSVFFHTYTTCTSPRFLNGHILTPFPRVVWILFNNVYTPLLFIKGHFHRCFCSLARMISSTRRLRINFDPLRRVRLIVLSPSFCIFGSTLHTGYQQHRCNGFSQLHSPL
jgi:hypothetical protein